MRAILVIASCILLIQCNLTDGRATSNEVNRLSIGMTKAQVLEIIGQPDSSNAQGRIEILLWIFTASVGYNYDGRLYQVTLSNGTVTGYGVQ